MKHCKCFDFKGFLDISQNNTHAELNKNYQLALFITFLFLRARTRKFTSNISFSFIVMQKRMVLTSLIIINRFHSYDWYIYVKKKEVKGRRRSLKRLTGH